MRSDHSQRGFTLYEVLAASAILFAAISIVFPIVSLIAKERQVIQDRVVFANKLHDELELRIVDSGKTTAEKRYSLTLGKTSADFQFSKSNSELKGCVIWNNAKNKQETFCLYGYLEK